MGVPPVPVVRYRFWVNPGKPMHRKTARRTMCESTLRLSLVGKSILEAVAIKRECSSYVDPLIVRVECHPVHLGVAKRRRDWWLPTGN